MPNRKTRAEIILMVILMVILAVVLTVIGVLWGKAVWV